MENSVNHSVKSIEILEIQKPATSHQQLMGYGMDFPSTAKSKFKEGLVPTSFKGANLPISGWVLGKDSRIVEVEVECNGIIIGHATPSIQRPDIHKKYPDIDDAKTCGFSVRCKTSKIKTDTDIVVYAIQEESKKRIEIATIKYRISSSNHQSSTPQNFFLLFNSRCGTTYLMDLLRNHPQIDSHMEIMGRYSAVEPQLSFLDKFFGSQRSDAVKAVGFKQQLVDITQPKRTINYMVNNYNPVIFKMTRRNIVKTAVSMIRANILNQTHNVSNAKNEQQKIGKVAIDPEQLLKKIKFREKNDKKLGDFIQNINLNVTVLYYEDLLYNKQVFLESIFQTLGVDEIALDESNFKKNTSDNLKDSIDNFDELIEFFSGTVYEEMFFEGVF